MGDANCVEEAMEIYKLLKSHIRKSGAPRVIYFVANKVDFPTDSLFQRKLEVEEMVGQDENCKVEKASMYDMRQVTHLFRGLLKDVQHLTRSGDDGRSSNYNSNYNDNNTKHSGHGRHAGFPESDKQDCE